MATADPSHPLLKRLGVTAAILGIIQGVVWVLLTFLAILLYLRAWKPEVSPQKYGEGVSYFILVLYLNKDENPEDDRYVTSHVFFGFTILYFILSIVWIAISATQLIVIQQQKVKILKGVLLSWTSCTAIICLCDLILASLIAADYDDLVTEVNKLGMLGVLTSSLGILACGIVMTLVARGFVLWIVNVIFAVVVLKLSSHISEHDRPLPYFNTSIPNNSETFDRASTPKGFNNPGYNWNDDPYARDSAQNLSKLPPIQSTNERLAKIGRQGAKSPAPVVPPKVPQSQYIYPREPRVPSPDYSPPNSPMQSQLKPALKNRPQNVFGFPKNRY